MPNEPKGFGPDVGVELCRCSVAVCERVVRVVQFGEPFRQGQLVPEVLVDTEGQLTWGQLAGQHPSGKCSCGGSPSGNSVEGVEGEAQFEECWGKELGDVVHRLRSCARRQGPQSWTVEAVDECVTGTRNDVGGADLANAPKGGAVLKLAGC